MLGSQNFVKLDDSVRDYHQSLQTKSEQEIDHMHMENMNQLEDLTRKLKESMAVLDVTVPEEPGEEGSQRRLEESPELSNNARRTNQAFGRHTFKTEAQQVTLSQQLNQFREAQQMPASQPDHLKKERQIVQNPFASYNENALGQLGDLDRAAAGDQPAFARQVPLNDMAAEVTHQEVDTPELQRARDLMSGEQRVMAPEDEERDGEEQARDPGGQGRSAFRMDDLEDLDEEEMKRIEKILKQH